MITNQATEGRFSRRLRNAAGRLRDERGSFIVEAMVSAFLLLVLAMGFLSALDTAAMSSGNLKSRGVAASLARDDMERLRAFKVADLVGLNATRTQVVGGATYTISSTTRWVDDVNGGATCGSGASKTDYLKVVSTVTYPSMGTTQPVKNESLVAIPNGAVGGATGGLIAKVTGSSGAAIAGVGVTITGPATGSGSTDVGGCMLWSALAPGGYYVDISRPGYVDRAGSNVVRRTASVIAGATNSVAFEYDQAASANVAFDTQIGASVQPAQGVGISYQHGGMPQGTVNVTSATSATSISTGARVFPFADAYAVWGGACAGADPRTYGQTTPMVTFAPGAIQSVTVRMPALNLRIQKNGVAFTAANVRISPATAGCGSTFSNPAGQISSAGALTQPGMPYGDYNVCIDDGSRRVQTSSAIQNRAPGGTTLTTLNITASSTAGRCS